MTPLSRTRATFAPPITESRRWLQGMTFPPERPLINVSQAAPVAPPPKALREVIAEHALNNDDAHLYGPDLGLPALREELAERWSAAYGGSIQATQVAITSGCNHGFAATIAAITGEGDEVVIPTPWYFNHKMWLDMSGVRAVPLSVTKGMLPDPAACSALITDKTRAIALVSPNNPVGVEYPDDLVRAFYDLAKARGIHLILDETYRDFDSRTGPVHDLFAQPDWDKTLVHLYSFSKAYRLTGHRVGAMMTSPALLDEVEKFIDSVTICPNQLAQHAALWGLRNLEDFLAKERAEILTRRAAIETGFPALNAKGWELLGLGAYFAYVSHPYDMPSDVFARNLVQKAGILLLPATMFVPPDDPSGAGQLRIAFANLDSAGIKELFERLQTLAM
ncbi:MAG: aminotransferase [Arenibacterium sp.]